MENPDCLETSIEVDSPNLTCEICIEPMTHDKIFDNNKRCAHPFCRDCIANYIAVKVEERVAQVPCPSSNCEELFDPLSCHPILPSELFEKWCDLLCESEVLSLENAYCPSVDCSALILNECGGNITRSECPNCKKLMCFQCKLPWHSGFRCDEIGDMRDENDILFGQLVERNKWKICPGCKFRVERNQGCQNIKCRCGVLFCYTCGKVKDSCVCYRRNVEVVVDHHLEVGHMRNREVVRNNNTRRNDNGWLIRIIKLIIIIVYLMSNAFFIALIDKLFKMKGHGEAPLIFGMLILFLYVCYVGPLLYVGCLGGFVQIEHLRIYV